MIILFTYAIPSRRYTELPIKPTKRESQSTTRDSHRANRATSSTSGVPERHTYEIDKGQREMTAGKMNFESLQKSIKQQFLSIPKDIHVPKEQRIENTALDIKGRETFKDPEAFNRFKNSLSKYRPISPKEQWTRSHEVVLRMLQSRLNRLGVKLASKDQILFVWKLQSNLEYSHLFNTKSNSETVVSYNLYDRLLLNARTKQYRTLYPEKDKYGQRTHKKPLSDELFRATAVKLDGKVNSIKKDIKKATKLMEYEYYERTAGKFLNVASTVDLRYNLKDYVHVYKQLQSLREKNNLEPKELIEIRNLENQLANIFLPSTKNVWSLNHENVYQRVLIELKDPLLSFDFTKRLDLPPVAPDVQRYFSRFTSTTGTLQDKLDQIKAIQWLKDNGNK